MIVFSRIENAPTKGAPKGDLANKHSRADTNGMYAVKLKSQLAYVAEINEVGRDVDEKPQPTRRRAPSYDRHVLVAAQRLLSVD